MSLLELGACLAHVAVAMAVVAASRLELARTLRACAVGTLALGSAAASAFWQLQLCGDWCPQWAVGEVAVGVVALALLRRRALPFTPPWPRAAVGFVALMALSFAVQIWLRAGASPTGSYDASANWNLRARAVWLAGARWNEFFANQPGIPHPDYPMGLPLAVARLWRVCGEATHAVPLGLGVASAALCAMAVAAMVSRLRGPRAGALAAAMVLGAPELARQAVAQGADVPVALAFTVAGVFGWLALEAGTWRPWALCGALLGVAIWLKNEALLFALLLGAAAVLLTWRRGGARAVGATVCGLALGALPFALTLFAHKALVPQANELLPFGRFGAVWQLATDGARWRLGMAEIGRRLLGHGHFLGIAGLVAVIAAGARWRDLANAGWQLVAGVTVAMVLGHFAVALISPYDLAFHIQTTQTRLLVQLWPLTVLALLGLWRDPVPPRGG